MAFQELSKIKNYPKQKSTQTTCAILLKKSLNRSILNLESSLSGDSCTLRYFSTFSCFPDITTSFVREFQQELSFVSRDTESL